MDTQGKIVKTNDIFGEIGWWVNTNLDDQDVIIYVEDLTDRAPESRKDGYSRLHFVYAGTNKPSEDEAKKIVEKYFHNL